MQQPRINPFAQPRRNNRRNGRARANANRAPRSGNVRADYAPSRFDATVQTRTINWSTRVNINNTKDGMAFGIGNVNLKFDASQPYLHEWLNNQSRIYEQFKVRRARVFIMPGAHFTNDIRIKSKVLARVDTDNMVPSSTAATLGYLMASSNTCTRMLPDAREIKLADWNPVCKPFLAGQATDDGRQLPNMLQWMAIRDNNGNPQYQNYEWKGCQLALVTPDESYPANQPPTLNVRIRLDIQFRGRISTDTVFSTTTITQPNDIPAPPTYDITGQFSDVRNNILGGTWFPIGTEWNSINVANVGTDLSLDLTGFSFRVQSDMTIYQIQTWDNPTTSFGADLV